MEWTEDVEIEEEEEEEEIELFYKTEDLMPCVFTSITPAWYALHSIVHFFYRMRNNLNLKRIALKVMSPLIFAHVRAAFPGMLVTEANCHPFHHGRFMWMHNGTNDTKKKSPFHCLHTSIAVNH